MKEMNITFGDLQYVEYSVQDKKKDVPINNKNIFNIIKKEYPDLEWYYKGNDIIEVHFKDFTKELKINGCLNYLHKALQPVSDTKQMIDDFVEKIRKQLYKQYL